MDPELDTHGSGTFAWIRIRNNSFRTHNTAFGGILHLELLRILELKLFIFQTVCDGFQLFKITKAPSKEFFVLKEVTMGKQKIKCYFKGDLCTLRNLKTETWEKRFRKSKNAQKIRFKRSRCRFLICENLLTLKGYLGTDVKSQ